MNAIDNENDTQKEINTFSLEKLNAAVAGNAAAFRQITRLHPAGGTGSKVFPPTHSGGLYAWEKRRMANGEVLTTVLLDSVQSQANRMEQALLEALRAGKIKLPLLLVDFSDYFEDIGIITTFDAPHRIADAIFRDSLLDGKKFRESDIGKKFVSSNIRNATGLFQHCPHALVFGVWDSTGSEGGLGNKFQRAVVSEIVGINAEKGVHTSSRIDPLGITKAAEMYRTNAGDWTLNSEEAKKNKKGESERAKPSDFVHGNIPPTIDGDERSGPLRGGVTIDHAIQTIVLSLPALRRLRFPVNNDQTQERNNAARTVLAALGLSGICHMHENGYDLRSRCLLIPDGIAPFEVIENDGKIEMFKLNSKITDKILQEAITQAKEVGLPWQEDAVILTPEDRLLKAVSKSREAKSSVEE